MVIRTKNLAVQFMLLFHKINTHTFSVFSITPKERKNLPTRCNLYLGSEIHKIAQKIICEKKTLNQAFLEHEKN